MLAQMADTDVNIFDLNAYYSEYVLRHAFTALLQCSRLESNARHLGIEVTAGS
jgi:hypothetical protein